MKNCFLLIAIASFLLGCSGNKKENTLQDEEGTPVINLSSDNVSKVALLPLSEAAAKVEIVSLEVTDESLIGEITKMKVTDSDIWVKHYKDNHVLRFSRSGKFLNKVGKVGQGPEEYIRMADFFVDENTKEVYIQTTIVGVKVYDYEGNYKRTAAKTSPDDVFMTMYFQFALYDNKFFIAQNLAFINKPTPKDSVWSFAWVDSTYQKKKIFKNPVHIGKEDQIIKNRVQMNYMFNYWLESSTNIDTYNNQLTLKFPDTDTIYSYDSIKEELVPQYAIFVDEEKGDYEYTHLWFRDRKAFDYFSIHSYYSTKENIYLVGSKGEEVYIYCYNKQEKNVRLQKQQGEITERDVSWFSIPFRRMECPFVLSNDLCGGDFIIDFRSSGKYWVDVLYLGNDGNRVDLNQIKSSTVIDESKKKELIRVLESATEDSNPVLMIATLK